MKTKLIAAAAILSAAILSWTAPEVFAGKGGGHGSAGVSGGGRGGSRGYSASSSGYSKGYSAGYKGPSAGLRGYTGGGLGRVHSNYAPKNYAPKYSSAYSNQRRTYSAGSNVYTKGSGKQYSTLNASKQRINRNQTGISGGNRVANVRDNRTALGKNNVKVGTTSLANRKGGGDWARNNPKNKSRFDQGTQDKLRNWQGNKSNWAEAKQRNRDLNGDHDGHHDGHHNDHHDGHHNHHDHDWWNHHCSTIVFVDWGWWGWWDGWWYPAWGYDPYYHYYAYDGPIYGYGGLAPDEAVANVQAELQRLGYYYDVVDGIMGPNTQNALIRFQRDRGLEVTGTVDPDTVGALGLS